MNDLKTTLTGALTVIVALATYKGWIDETIGGYVTALGAIVFSYFVADSNNDAAPQP